MYCSENGPGGQTFNFTYTGMLGHTQSVSGKTKEGTRGPGEGESETSHSICFGTI